MITSLFFKFIELFFYRNSLSTKWIRLCEWRQTIIVNILIKNLTTNISTLKYHWLYAILFISLLPAFPDFFFFALNFIKFEMWDLHLPWWLAKRKRKGRNFSAKNSMNIAFSFIHWMIHYNEEPEKGRHKSFGNEKLD